MSCCGQYLWLVIVGGVFAFAAAFGIGTYALRFAQQALEILEQKSPLSCCL
eukprot:COSAG02_NODE_6675_length_3424_cov_16.009624_2_plen_51_part_00